MKTWFCRQIEMLFRLNYKNVKIKYMTLLAIAMYFIKMVSENIKA